MVAGIVLAGFSVKYAIRLSHEYQKITAKIAVWQQLNKITAAAHNHYQAASILAIFSAPGYSI